MCTTMVPSSSSDGIIINMSPRDHLKQVGVTVNAFSPALCTYNAIDCAHSVKRRSIVSRRGTSMVSIYSFGRPLSLPDIDEDLDDEDVGIYLETACFKCQQYAKKSEALTEKVEKTRLHSE